MDRSFLKHAAIYGMATMLVQAGSFVLLPIYLRGLNRAEYGVLEIVGRLAETLATLLLLGGFRQALFTFYQQANDEPARRRVVVSAYLLIGSAGVLGALATLAASPWIGPWLFGATGSAHAAWLLPLAVAGILLEPFNLLPLTLIQARVESATYVVVVISQFLVRVCLCILLVRVFAWGVAGALIATAATGLLFGAVLTGRELARGVAWPGLAQLRAMLWFALPLLPGGICFFVLHHGDRFFLLRHATAGEIGSYALGYKLGMVVKMLTLGPLLMVWSARMYAVAREPDAPVQFGRATTRILGAYLLAGLGLCLFAGEIVTILGGEEYAAAVPIVAPVVLACFFQSAATLMDAAFFIRGRTGQKFGVSLVATAAMLLLYWLLIPPYGAIGAALATAGGFAILALATYWTSQRLFPVSYEWGRLIGLTAVAVAGVLIGASLPPTTWAPVARLALFALLIVLAWASPLVHGDERRQVLGGIGLALSRLKGRPEGSIA
ncbi:MAG: lipopolysaccharide biosynthesis protein [Gemmataceae bacterium]